MTIAASAFVVFMSLGAAPSPAWDVAGDGFAAGFHAGALIRLVDADGHAYVVPPAAPLGLGVHTLAGEFFATGGEIPEPLRPGGTVVQRYDRFRGREGARAEGEFSLSPDAHEVILQQQVTTREAGLWGVSWSIGRIPLEYAILVPGQSGIRLTADSPGHRHQFDYPIGWEAQLVIVEGPGRGFYVWAEDAQGRFKRLVVERNREGWQLTLVTMNFAPFDALTACRSVPWHVGVYHGDWRVPARRYRQWMEAHFGPVPIAHQKPAWVRDIRCLVIMGLSPELLAELAQRLDPGQTMLYLPAWRSAGYDRDYPTYDAADDALGPFVEQAHALGFRVMLHVNYFGVDPKHALYEQFARYQVRDPWGDHARQWWVWDRAEPEIRFAYINPACRAWREYFVGAMAQLCRRYPIDALHLDQTLCIYNDHNGLIDGQSMLDGNLALHRALREALPAVALSGEGLNEITCRYEAFAQRHAWGINHADGTSSRRPLGCAHPISSYLLRPYTVINGYLGCAPPTQGQLYAAWNEAYEHWGVIPTLKPDRAQLRAPTDFSRQFFDEADCWLRHRLEIDLDGPWPAEVAFPFRTADGRPAVRTVDGRFLCDGCEISRTVTGVGQLATTGTIPGWRAYDDQRLLGLDPDHWYPCFPAPREPGVFHVASLPDDVICAGVIARDQLAVFQSRGRNQVVADLVARLEQATCGSEPFSGAASQWAGPGTAADGGSFTEAGDGVLAAHPPWKTSAKTPAPGTPPSGGRGVAYARFQVALPAAPQLLLCSEIGLAHGATGPDRSDGVTFLLTASAGATRLETQLHQAGEEPQRLELDLTPLAGQPATVELAVHPGPQRAPSFDWARWYRPRIERRGQPSATVRFAGAEAYPLALDARGPQPIQREGNLVAVDALQPGAVLLLRQPPPPIGVPADVARLPRIVVFVDGSGRELTDPEHAAVRPERLTVGGVTKPGLFVHPPHQGRTIASLPLTLPREPVRFACSIGIRDGSRSDGVVFAVEVNGGEVARRAMVPGAWEPLSADLARHAGQPIVLSLVTDADGPFNFDWACWGEPRLEPNADRTGP